MAYDLPSWLQADAPSEPWKALLAGVQAGSGIASNINQNRAIAQRRYEFDAEQARLSQLDAVRQTVIDQQLELGRINIKNNIIAQEEKIRADRAISGAAKLFGEHQLAGIAGTDASEARIWSYISNNPEFYIHPGAKDFEAKVGLARQARERASQYENEMLVKLAQQEALTERTAMNVVGRQDVADTRAVTELEKANIAAKAKVDAALVAASKWKDHSRFAAFKDASAAIKLQIDPVKDPDNYAKAVQDIYNKLLPSGEPNAWDTGGGTIPVPVKPMFRWTPEGIKKSD